jgi:membrane peptidoglycan carboxypeptidase
MPSTADIVHRRRERRAVARRRSESRLRGAGLGLGYVFSIALAIAIFALALAYADLTRDLPSVEQLPILLNPPNGLLLQPTRLTDRTGEHTLFTFAPSDRPRLFVPRNLLPESLVNATIAAAEPNFENSPGYVLTGLDNPESHPTLAQKLAYDLLLFGEAPSLRRALRERLLAAQITARYGRDQVMEWTLNSANYGRYAFGVDAASHLYFDTTADKLTLAESAMLASVSQTPSLNPIDAPDAAEQHARETLLLMKALGMISEKEATLPSPFGRGAGGEVGGQGASALLNLAMTQLSTRYDRQRLERGGLVIVTTIDYDLQTQAICLTELYAARLAGESPDTTGCPAARLLSALPSNTTITEPSASALVLDPRTGQILALVGETNAGKQTPSLTAHNPGSLLTPFVYLTGFTRGLGPASLVWDIPGGEIQNQDNLFHGPMRLRAALANDYLVPAVDVLNQMGAQNAVNTARSFGLDIAPGPAFESDSAPQTLLNLAAAYGTFAALGLHNGQSFDYAQDKPFDYAQDKPFGDAIQPSAVLRVDTFDGATWLDWSQPDSQSVVSPQLAYLMNDVLSDGPARWPSWGNPNVLEIGRPAAVKSGWTGGADAWTIGYTPARLVAVWTGSISPLPTGQSETGPGVRASAALWSALMQTASASLPPDGWTKPAGVTEMDVCDPSGLLPTNDCPAIVREVFLNGFEPTQGDTLFRSYSINRETGLLATVFTPPELVEKRVFMVVPEQARAWAAVAGIPVPPEAYDAIQAGVQNPNVNIASPAMFAEISGRVQITGSALGDGFQYYRIQVGQGLNPKDWIQIGANVTTPVTNGPLAEWDTSGLSGLYAIQLVVVYADQRVETAVIQVTVK